IITHAMACAKITSNRMVVLVEGKIRAIGTYEELEKSEDPVIQSFFL
ncbi:MAG: ABC transporter ATP-binding protein, partial [Chitinophagaceae bacterium]